MRDPEQRCVVIGIGNPDRGDDAVGRRIAEKLRGRLRPEITVLEHDGEAASLLACLEGAAEAYLIDACRSGMQAGRVHRLDVARTPLPPGRFGVSSHAIALAEAIELARALGRLPARCIVYAVEAADFTPGAALSPPAAAAVEAVCQAIEAEIAAPACFAGRHHKD